MDNTEKILAELKKWHKENQEINRKLDLALKALNLVPVTEDELRKIQIQQRDNLNKAATVAAELDAMENKDNPNDTSIENLYKNPRDVYGDVLGEDILGGLK